MIGKKLIVITLSLLFLVTMAYLTYIDSTLFTFVVASGFLDGIHPCGFAVLTFFIAFLLAAKKPRNEIILVGGIFIFGVFLAYLLIGMGILKAITILPPHFMAKAGAVLLVFLGLVYIKDAFMKTTTFKMPVFIKPYLQKNIEKSTIPASFVAGLLVGLCAFPCAGGIYVAVLGLVALKFGFVESLGFLIIYNLMFVMPLILVLAFASNGTLLNKLEVFERDHKKKYKLIMAVLMFALAAFIFLSASM